MKTMNNSITFLETSHGDPTLTRFCSRGLYLSDWCWRTCHWVAGQSRSETCTSGCSISHTHARRSRWRLAGTRTFHHERSRWNPPDRTVFSGTGRNHSLSELDECYKSIYPSGTCLFCRIISGIYMEEKRGEYQLYSNGTCQINQCSQLCIFNGDGFFQSAPYRRPCRRFPWFPETGFGETCWYLCLRGNSH